MEKVLPSLTSRLTSIGIKPSYASMLAKGQRKPSLRQAVEIEDKAGIPPRYWIHGEEPSHTSAAGNTITGASVYGLAGGEVVTRPVAAIGGGHG